MMKKHFKAEELRTFKHNKTKVILWITSFHIGVKFIFYIFHYDNFITNVCFLTLSYFSFFPSGVRQGQKLDKKDYPANDADHYESQNVNSSEENHTYEQPLPSTGHTPTGYEQELATYYVLM